MPAFQMCRHVISRERLERQIRAILHGHIVHRHMTHMHQAKNAKKEITPEKDEGNECASLVGDFHGYSIPPLTAL